jgi:hypothetical protein
MREPKPCGRCKRVLPASAFAVRGKQRPGRRWACRDCERIIFRAGYLIGRYKPGERKSPKKAADPFKQRARSLLQSAVRRGEMVRQPCLVCGKAKTDAHHRDYRRPYDVLWLCRRHHLMTHRLPTDTPFTEADAIRALKAKP